MKRYTMFIEWKAQYYKDILQTDIQAKFQSHYNLTNGS